MLRTERKIALRKFADMVGISPTYLSQVERDEFAPPAEDKVLLMADLLEQDPDELLALAGRVRSDLSQIIQLQPREMATFLRTASGLSPEELHQLIEQAEKRKHSLD